MKKGFLKTFSIAIVNYLIISLIIAFPYVLSKNISVVYAEGIGSDENEETYAERTEMSLKGESYPIYVISEKGFYYLENVEFSVEVRGVTGDVSSMSYEISIDGERYTSSCLISRRSIASTSFDCTIPLIKGVMSPDIYENSVIEGTVKLTYYIDGFKRIKYFDLSIPLQEPTFIELEYDMENFDSEDFILNFVGYNSADNERGFCMFKELNNPVSFKLNVTTNYPIASSYRVSVDDATFMVYGTEILADADYSCSVVEVYDEGIIEFECEVDSLNADSGWFLCSDESLSSGSFSELDGNLLVKVFSGEANYKEYEVSVDGYYYIEEVYDKLEYDMKIYGESPDTPISFDCYRYGEDNPYCIPLDEKGEYKPIDFNIFISGFDGSYEIIEYDVVMNIDNNYLGNPSLDLVLCDIEDRTDMNLLLSCEAYLPLIEYEGLDTVSISVLLRYSDGEEEYSEMLSKEGVVDINVRDDAVPYFMFIEYPNIKEEGNPEIVVSTSGEEYLGCLIDPYNNICYFGEISDDILRSVFGSSFENEEFKYPFELSIKGYVFSNILDVVSEEDGLFNIEVEVSSIEERVFNYVITKNDCEIDEHPNFKGIYMISCSIDLSTREPFKSGIPYDPRDPPQVSYFVAYADGNKRGEIIFSEMRDVEIEKDIIDIVGNMDVSIVDRIYNKEYMSLILSLSPSDVLDESTMVEGDIVYAYGVPSKTLPVNDVQNLYTSLGFKGVPVCKLPVRLTRIFAEGVGCDPQDYQCLFNERDKFFNPQEKPECIFRQGIALVIKIDGIYNKSSYAPKTLYYAFREDKVYSMDATPRRCYDIQRYSEFLSSLEENKTFPLPLCEDYYGPTSESSKCDLYDYGEEGSYIMMCELPELGITMDWEDIPLYGMYYYSAEDPLIVTLSSDDNGYLRNGTDIYTFDYIVENTYGTITFALNTYNQYKDAVQRVIEEINRIYNRLMIVVGIITILDVTFGSNMAPSFLAYTTPSTCLVGCISCVTSLFSGGVGYSACVKESYLVGSPSCGTCVPLFDGAFVCTTAGSLWINDFLKGQLDRASKDYEKSMLAILKLQYLLNNLDIEVQAGEYGTTSRESSFRQFKKDVKDMANKLKYTSYYAKILNENIGSPWKDLLKWYYTGLCGYILGKSILSIKEVGIGEAVLYGSLIGAGTTTAIEYVFTGRVEGETALKGGITGGLGGVAAAWNPVLMKVITGYGLAFVGANFIIGYLSGGAERERAAFMLGSTFLAAGIGMAIAGAIQLMEIGVKKGYEWYLRKKGVLAENEELISVDPPKEMEIKYRTNNNFEEPKSERVKVKYEIKGPTQPDGHVSVKKIITTDGRVFEWQSSTGYVERDRIDISKLP